MTNIKEYFHIRFRFLSVWRGLKVHVTVMHDVHKLSIQETKNFSELKWPKRTSLSFLYFMNQWQVIGMDWIQI